MNSSVTWLSLVCLVIFHSKSFTHPPISPQVSSFLFPAESWQFLRNERVGSWSPLTSSTRGFIWFYLSFTISLLLLFNLPGFFQISFDISMSFLFLILISFFFFNDGFCIIDVNHHKILYISLNCSFMTMFYNLRFEMVLTGIIQGK